MRSTVYITEFNDEISPAHNLEGWAKWLSGTDPINDDDCPPRPIKDGEVFEVFITDCQEITAMVDEQTITYAPDFIEAERYGIQFGPGMGWTEDDDFADRASLEAEMIERLNDGGEPEFYIGCCTDRKGSFTVTYRLTDDGPILQPDGWVL